MLKRLLTTTGASLALALAVPALAAADPPGCASSSYAEYVTIDEAQYIGADRAWHWLDSYGGGAGECTREWNASPQRTKLAWHHIGRNGWGQGDYEEISMVGYIYGSASAGYDVGAIYWFYDMVDSSRSGFLGSPD